MSNKLTLESLIQICKSGILITNRFLKKTLPYTAYVALYMFVVIYILDHCLYPLKSTELFKTSAIILLFMIIYAIISMWIFSRFIRKNVILISNLLLLLTAVSCLIKAGMYL